MNFATKKPSELVEEYIALRDDKDKATKMYKEHCREHYDEPMDVIEAQLLNLLDELGVDSLSGKTGTAYKNTARSVTTADMVTFRNYVIDTEQWELADWKPNKTVVGELVENNQPVPPGVNYTATLKIGIRRK